jgi:hypothetical protein
MHTTTPDRMEAARTVDSDSGEALVRGHLARGTVGDRPRRRLLEGRVGDRIAAIFDPEAT